MEMKDDNKANILDLLRTPNMRKKTLAMCFNWFACGLCFYGLTQYVSNLGGDLFVNVAVSGNHRNSSVHIQCYSKTLGKRESNLCLQSKGTSSKSFGLTVSPLKGSSFCSYTRIFLSRVFNICGKSFDLDT